MRMHESCADCGLVFERHDGFFLGAMPISYAMTFLVWLLPVGLLWGFGIVGDVLAVILAVIGAVGFPLLFYRTSRSWNLGLYYAFLPHELPANRRSDIPVDDLDVSVPRKEDA